MCLHGAGEANIILKFISLFAAKLGAGMLGDPINCMADGVPGGAMDLFCWIHSTFSVSSRFAKQIF